MATRGRRKGVAFQKPLDFQGSPKDPLNFDYCNRVSKTANNNCCKAPATFSQDVPKFLRTVPVAVTNQLLRDSDMSQAEDSDKQVSFP